MYAIRSYYVLLGQPGAAAGLARLVDDVALAAAVRARAGDREEAGAAAYLARALAGRADLAAAAGLGARAGAGAAALVVAVRYLDGRAEDGLLEAQLQVVAQVRSARRLAAPAAAARRAGAASYNFV